MTDREEARPPTRFGFVAVDRERLVVARSEEHTSELQSQSNLVCRLLLEKKKKNMHITLRRYLTVRAASAQVVYRGSNLKAGHGPQPRPQHHHLRAYLHHAG